MTIIRIQTHRLKRRHGKGPIIKVCSIPLLLSSNSQTVRYKQNFLSSLYIALFSTIHQLLTKYSRIREKCKNQEFATTAALLTFYLLANLFGNGVKCSVFLGAFGEET